MKAWLVPISNQAPVKRGAAHFMEASNDTHLLVTSACGRKFNPGFAELPPKRINKCFLCERKLAR